MEGAVTAKKAKLQARLGAAIEALERIKRGHRPTVEELAAAPLLQHWCVTDSVPWPERHDPSL